MSHLGVKGNPDVKLEEENCEENESKTNLWLEILNEVQENSSKKLPSNKVLLVLGDNGSGKTSLIARLQGNESPTKGSGLEFHNILVADEYRDEHTRLSAYVLDGDSWHRNLLKFVLNENTLGNTSVVLTASMASPSTLMESLNHWAGILREHVERLRLPQEALKEHMRKVERRFSDYVEPGSEVLDVTSPVRPTAAEEPGDKQIQTNLGLDITVVITKTDYLSTLESEFDFKEEHFDYIQKEIRNFCLQYGAALFYVSVKEDKNCDLLLKYLLHRIYAFPFRTSALVVEKDSIFIPSGWDSEKKIGILLDNLPSGDPYHQVIVRPVGRKPMEREGEVLCEEDMAFLLRLQNMLNQQSPHPNAGRPPINTTQEIPIRTPAGVQKTADRRLSGSPGVNASPKKLEGKHGTVGGEGVLQNFFNSLLNRRTGSTGTTPSPNVRDKSSARVDAAAELDRMSGSPGFKKGLAEENLVDEPEDKTTQS